VEETPGAGLSAEIEGNTVRLGTARHCGIGGDISFDAMLWLRDGESMPIPFRFEDALREDAGAVVEDLRRQGYAVELLSGDRTSIARDTAVAVGIEDWRAEQRPGDKIGRIDQHAHAGRRVLMVGDGLNDAPALAAGHASLSPSTAADISQTAADAVFQGRLLGPVLETLRVARMARRLALENFGVAVGYNLVFVPLAMAGRVTPLLAAIAMSASSIAVTANALRLSRSTGKGLS
jgi:Cu2+-exporting ATPase